MSAPDVLSTHDMVELGGVTDVTLFLEAGDWRSNQVTVRVRAPEPRTPREVEAAMGPLPPVGRCRGGRPAAARVLAVTVLLACWLWPAPARAETPLAAPVEPLDADESYLVLARLQAGQPVAVGDLHRALHSSQLVADPWTWALECFAVSAGEEAGRRDNLTEVELDLDGDGARELLLGSTVDRGNAGGTFYVLRHEGASYRTVGTLFLHPRAFAVVQRPGEQRPTVWRYLRLGAGSGRLESLVLDGSTFTVTSAEEVEPFGRGRGRLCALFGQLFCGSGELDKPAAEPVSSLADAVAAAERYVAEHDLDPTGQYLHSVRRMVDERAGGSYWLAQWQWSAPRLGGELGLRVYPDGTVEEARLGP